MRASFAPLALLVASVSAHFSITTPTPRGDTGETQDESPCGGINTPSDTRTKWSLEGPNQLSFEAGHDEAETAVYLALGDNPTADDFTIVLVDQFNQIGLGEFCWNTLQIPEGTEGVEDGVNATIQIVQRGHSGGGLYNVCSLFFDVGYCRAVVNGCCSAPISRSRMPL
jgi:hypothetical protein